MLASIAPLQVVTPPRLGLYVGLALALLGLDQLAKWLVMRYLTPYQPYPILPFLDFTYTINRGVAFGLWVGGGSYLLVLTAICLALLIFMASFYAARSHWAASALTFIVGGALGNLWDRLRWGYVIDFIDFKIWPVFNLADVWIVLGAFLLLGYGLWAHREVDKSTETPCSAEEEDL